MVVESVPGGICDEQVESQVAWHGLIKQSFVYVLVGLSAAQLISLAKV